MEVQLVELEEKHLQNVFKWIQDPFISANLGVRNVPSLKYTYQWFENVKAGNGNRPFAINLDNNPVGALVLDRHDSYLKTTRLSIYIGESVARGKGVAQIAIHCALSIAFKEMGINKVWLIVHRENHHAFRLYRKMGFVVEGELKDEFIFQGKLINVFYMGILKKDFCKQNEGNP